MGIRQLQTFVQKCVSGGYKDVSLYEECEKFRRQNNDIPILLIDFQGLLQPLIEDKRELLCGIRHNIIYEKIDKLFEKLSQIAELVFYDDGIYSNAKTPEKHKRKNNRFESFQKIAEKIDQKWTLEEIVEAIKDYNSPKPTSHSSIAKLLAKKYGIVKKAMDAECDIEMAKFAFENPNVLAILGEDSDFLIYPGNWKYFSLRDLNQETLVTKEYSRIALRKTLKLNDKELVILSTLNGNDVIAYDDTFRFHKSLINQRNNPAQRFPAIAQYIIDHQLLLSKNLFSQLAHAIFRSNSDCYFKKIEESFKHYNIKFGPLQINAEFEALKFCKENFFVYAFKILSEKPLTVSLNYFDHSSCNNDYEIVIRLFRKQLGIIFNDMPDKSYTIYSKNSYEDINYLPIDVNPIIPIFDVPPFIELLDRPQHPEHDKTRFNLLKWLINDDKLANINLELIPKNLLIDVLTLTFMVTEGFINVTEADIILLSIKLVEDGLVPESLTPPNILQRRAFFLSFMFSKSLAYLAKTMKIIGLKQLIKIHNFDGMQFHKLYLEHVNQPYLIADLLGDYMEYRFYA